jgi:pimeloyl-ACP methyl ester carboxylesterase
MLCVATSACSRTGPWGAPHPHPRNACTRRLGHEPDPIVYLSGGPGGAGSFEVAFMVKHGLNAERDVIFVDQRGTHHADPFLACLEYELRPLGRRQAAAGGVVLDGSDQGAYFRAHAPTSHREEVDMQRTHTVSLSSGATAVLLVAGPALEHLPGNRSQVSRDRCACRASWRRPRTGGGSSSLAMASSKSCSIAPASRLGSPDGTSDYIQIGIDLGGC